MLHFSKLKIFLIGVTSLFFIFIASSNFFSFESNLIKKKLNLGLDLQGGSYLLLEIDNSPVIEQKLQNLSITIRKARLRGGRIKWIGGSPIKVWTTFRTD